MRIRSLPLALTAAASAVLACATAATAAPAVPEAASVIHVSTASQLKSALTAAAPGDTIQLADGTYTGNFKVTTAARPDARITLTGSPKAVLRTNTGGAGLVNPGVPVVS